MLRPPEPPASNTATTDNETAAGSAKTEEEENTVEESEPPEPPTMRYAIRLFIDELFVAQQTGIVRQIDEENEEGSTWRLGSGPTSMLRRRIHPSWLPPQ